MSTSGPGPSPYPQFSQQGPDPDPVGAALPPPALATWGQRAGGYAFDVLIPAVVLGFALGFVLAIIGFSTFAANVVLYLCLLGWTIWNRWIMGGRTGQSLGRKKVGITLISEATGQPIGPKAAFVRDLAHLLDSLACYIGWLFPLWDAKRQTFADKIMKTVVVEAR